MLTDEERAVMETMSTARVRRNYWLCDEQIKMCAAATGRHLDNAAAKLQQRQDCYLSELVRRGERV